MGYAARSGEGYRALDPGLDGAMTARALPAKIGVALLLGLPGAMTVYFAFNSGGMFEVTTAFGALVVLVAMVVAVAVARRPFAGLTRGGGCSPVARLLCLRCGPCCRRAGRMQPGAR